MAGLFYRLESVFAVPWGSEIDSFRNLFLFFRLNA